MARKPPTYCPQHGIVPQPHQHASTKKQPRPTYRETQRRKALIAQWLEEVGPWCNGWQTPGHPSWDLTADHITPRSQAGDDGPLRVLCRTCNSRRGTNTPHRNESKKP